MNLRGAFALLRNTYTEWNEDKASRLAAALAYYTLFSLAPLLVVMILVVGLILGEEAVRGQLVGQISGVVGSGTASLIQTMVDNASRQRSGGILPMVIGFAVLLLGAAGLFGALQGALNTVWEVQPAPAQGLVNSIKATAIQRGLTLLAVLGVCLLLLATVLASTVLTAVAASLGPLLPGFSYIWFALNILISLAIVTPLFALIYKVLPAADIAWGDVWVGAAATALLFVIGKELIGLYLGRVSVGSIYGAAGSLVVLLVWIYYSAQIFLFGAEFTQVYAKTYGTRLRAAKRPAEHAAPGPLPAPSQAAPQEAQAPPHAAKHSLLAFLEERYAAIMLGVIFVWMLATLRELRGRPDNHR